MVRTVPLPRLISYILSLVGVLNAPGAQTVSSGLGQHITGDSVSLNIELGTSGFVSDNDANVGISSPLVDPLVSRHGISHYSTMKLPFIVGAPINLTPLHVEIIVLSSTTSTATATLTTYYDNSVPFGPLPGGLAYRVSSSR